MIIDKIENSGIYKNISQRIAIAFDYIHSADLRNTVPGRYEIDGDNIYAIVSEYISKPAGECKLEAHKKYIDIQYVISGSEQMGIASLYDQVPVSSDIEKDCAFYNCDMSLIKVEEGMFTIFFPSDLHMPGIQSGKPSVVKKVVIKVRKN